MTGSDVDLVIFDFDGTLADSVHWFASVFNAVARRYHFMEASIPDLERLRSEDARQALRRFGVARWKLPFIARHMRKLMARDIDQIHLFPGAADLLKNLSAAGVTLAIVSSNSRDNIDKVLGRDVASMISYYACGAGLLSKAAKFRSILKRSGALATRVIAIGDEVRDLEAAKAVGVVAGAVTWGYGAATALLACHPAFVFDSMDAITASIVSASDRA